MEIQKKCQNCGQNLEDPSLTDCSSQCAFETYLKSNSVSTLP